MDETAKPVGDEEARGSLGATDASDALGGGARLLPVFTPAQRLVVLDTWQRRYRRAYLSLPETRSASQTVPTACPQRRAQAAPKTLRAGFADLSDDLGPT